MSKRGGIDLKALTEKKSKLDAATSASASARGAKQGGNPYLSAPVQPEKALQIFLQSC